MIIGNEIQYLKKSIKDLGPHVRDQGKICLRYIEEEDVKIDLFVNFLDTQK